MSQLLQPGIPSSSTSLNELKEKISLDKLIQLYELKIEASIELHERLKKEIPKEDRNMTINFAILILYLRFKLLRTFEIDDDEFIEAESIYENEINDHPVYSEKVTDLIYKMHCINDAFIKDCNDKQTNQA